MNRTESQNALSLPVTLTRVLRQRHGNGRMSLGITRIAARCKYEGLIDSFGPKQLICLFQLLGRGEHVSVFTSAETNRGEGGSNIYS